MVVPSPSLPDLSKDSLRSAALDARKAFVRSLDDSERTRLELRLAAHLTGLCAKSRVVGGYSPLGSEISPLPTLEEATAVGKIAAFPAFSDPAKPFRFLAGQPTSPGLFGMLQPKRSAPEVLPDLILVPLIAIDGAGTRLGRGKGHYDRVLGRLRKNGALLIGVGWSFQRIESEIPADPWDVPLNGFACPEGLEIFR